MEKDILKQIKKAEEEYDSEELKNLLRALYEKNLRQKTTRTHKVESVLSQKTHHPATSAGL